MKLIGLSNDAKQNYVLTLPNGQNVDFSLRFVPNQSGWFYSVSYGQLSWASDNRRLVISPNMLRQYRNIIPFGLACFSNDGYEPIAQDDFLTGRVKLYILNEADVVAVESLIGV